jgi:hypothetical protein
MGLEFFLRAITADNDAEMLRVLKEYDEVLETARALQDLAHEDDLVAAG